MFINDNFTYKYFKNAFSSDEVIIYNNAMSTSSSHTLLHINAKLVFSPDYQFAFAWTKYTKIYIYNATTFGLLYIFNDSIISAVDKTETLNFCHDSSCLII